MGTGVWRGRAAAWLKALVFFCPLTVCVHLGQDTTIPELVDFGTELNEGGATHTHTHARARTHARRQTLADRCTHSHTRAHAHTLTAAAAAAAAAAAVGRWVLRGR